MADNTRLPFSACPNLPSDYEALDPRDTAAVERAAPDPLADAFEALLNGNKSHVSDVVI